MAKNLKLKIKNTQLTEALKGGKIKKPKALNAEKKATPKKTAAKKPAAPKSKIRHSLPSKRLTKSETANEPEIKEEELVEQTPEVAAPEVEIEQAAPVQEAPKEEATEVKETTTPSEEKAPAAKQEEPEEKPKEKKPPYKGHSTLVKPRPDKPIPKKTPPPAKRSTTADTTQSFDKKPGKPTRFKEYRDLKPQKRGAQQKAFDARDRQGLRDSDDERWRKKRYGHKGKGKITPPEEIIRPKELKVRLPITVKDLASEMKLKASELISKLFMQGVILTLNDFLDDETTIQLLGHEFDCEISVDTSEEERLRITDKSIKEEIAEAPEKDLVLRPPVVTFMGHVDHGKTSLIDAIRKSNITSGEVGAITQHIGAFRCHTAVGDITILDTPGHEAFTAMRSRGAEVTDIVVLVIAGDEGIRPQTLEALDQAKEAGVPIVVAINKCDKPNFNAENVYRQLSEQELLPEAWGGTTITVNCSAVSKEGIKELLEMLALQAEVLELKANPHTRARGAVIESQMHKGLGAVATLLVQNGTLKLGDALVFGHYWGRVKTMHDEYGKNVTEAPPSFPVKITGLSSLPEAGNDFIVVKNDKEARKLAEDRVEGHKRTELQQSKRSLEKLLQQKADIQKKKILNIVLRTDVQGSLEALKTSLLKIPSTKIELNFISAEVGEISEADVELGAASNAIILGFHTQIESRAEPLIKQFKVPVKLHDIIYHAVDDIKAEMLSRLDKIPQESDTGRAIVKAVFKSSKLGLIAGCQVEEGTISRNHHIRVLRNGKEVWKGEISSLQRGKDDVKEVNKGYECGILLRGYSQVQEDDILQAFEITYLTQTLE